MTIANFDELCKGLSEIAGVTAPALTPDEQGIIAFSVHLHEVAVSVAHAPQSSPHCAFVVIEFGDIPQDRALAAWTALLDANFLMMGESAPCFSRNPATGQVLLQYAYPFDTATALDLYQGIVKMTDIAQRWRDDHFLDAANLAGQPGRSEAVSAADFI